LELRELHNWKVGGFLAFKDPTGIGALEAIGLHQIGSIAHKSANFDELAPFIDCGKSIARCERHDLLASAVEERIGTNEQRSRPSRRHAGERGVNLALVAGMKDDDFLPNAAASAFGLLRIGHGGRKVGIGKNGERRRRRHCVFQ
jgi:hypothetical protein